MTIFNLVAAFIGIGSALYVVAEVYLHFVRKRRYYRFADVATNVQTLFLYQILGASALGFIYLCYDWIYSNLSLVQQDINSPLAWVFGFILADFCHYWFHRTSHQNNFLWGIHQGHHTSEDFNLSTAVRKGIFQQWVDWPFFLPMAVLGFPFLEMFLPLKALQFAYQLWLHNQFIDKIPYVEKVLVTPSAHRVHHGQNPQYIDKNHAGVFIIWDKLFGTFAEEKEKVVYGTTVAVNSFHPIGVQFTWWKDLWRDAVRTKRWRDKLAIPFKYTGWRPADVAELPRDNHITDLSRHKPFDVPIRTGTRWYVASQVLAMVVLLGTLTEQEFLPFSNPVHGFLLAYLLAGCASLGLILNNSPRGSAAEWTRHGLVIGLGGLGLLSGGNHPLFHLAVGVSLLSLVCYGALQLSARYAAAEGLATASTAKEH